MTPAVEIENLTKEYVVGFARRRRVRALDGLSLVVEPGEIFGFLGGNGAGKTTTIKLLLRLLRPTSGTARIGGRVVDDVAVRARVGYLPEQPYFYDYLTARELLAYCGALFGYPRAERGRRAEGLLARVGLDRGAWDRPLRRFSKGMLQRVGLAQALLNDPEVVFLDEPMSGLDPAGRREVRDLIASLPARGTTVFLSSHILADIEILCDRVAVLRGGRLTHCGRLDDLLRVGMGQVEVILAGGSPVALRASLAGRPGLRIVDGADGARVQAPSERDVDEVLRAARAAGARLVSVQPVRSSLEDLLVAPVSTPSPAVVYQIF